MLGRYWCQGTQHNYKYATLSIKVKNVTLSITLCCVPFLLSVTFGPIMLSVVLLNVVMLSDVLPTHWLLDLNVIMNTSKWGTTAARILHNTSPIGHHDTQYNDIQQNDTQHK
jgi:hypothetical protein